MKKSLFILAAALLSFASCSEEELVNVTYPQGNQVLVASFEQEGGGTRMNIASTDNALTWTKGDAIAVFGDGAVKYELQGEGGTSGTFKVAEGFSAPSTINGAAFPYDKDASFSSATLTMTLPYTLGQTKAGVCNVPMWGTVSDGNVEFKHLAGLLKVNLTNIPEGYNTLTVTASNPIAGKFTVNLEDKDNPVWVSSSTDDAYKTVTVQFTAATAEANDQVLYLPLPVGEYESIVVSISNGTDTKVLKQWAGKKVERAQVYSTSADCDTYVTSGTELTTAIKEGATINLGADITIPANTVVPANVTINGNGFSVSTNEAAGTSGKGKGVFMLNGGTINNVNFTSPNTQYDIIVTAGSSVITACKFKTESEVLIGADGTQTYGKRAIFTGSEAIEGTLSVSNCTFDDKVYAFNFSSANNKMNITFSKCSLNGWLSGHGNSHTFENCTFGKSGDYQNYIPYCNSTFTGCTFAAGFKISLKHATTLTFDAKCKVEETTLTGPSQLTWDFSGSGTDNETSETLIIIGKGEWTNSATTEEAVAWN